MDNLKISSEGVVHLKTLHKLRVLSLCLAGKCTSEEVLGVLRRLPQLRRLGLAETSLTDSGLAQLEKGSQLQELWLAATNVSAMKVEKLRKAMPNCKIEWEPATHDERQGGVVVGQPDK